MAAAGEKEGAGPSLRRKEIEVFLVDLFFWVTIVDEPCRGKSHALYYSGCITLFSQLISPENAVCVFQVPKNTDTNPSHLGWIVNFAFKEKISAFKSLTLQLVPKKCSWPQGGGVEEGSVRCGLHQID